MRSLSLCPQHCRGDPTLPAVPPLPHPPQVSKIVDAPARAERAIYTMC